MDNNETNDFAGPDGTVYKDAVQFAESCKISCKLLFMDRFRSVCQSQIKFRETKESFYKGKKLRRNSSDNWVSLIISGQKSYTRII